MRGANRVCKNGAALGAHCGILVGGGIRECLLEEKGQLGSINNLNGLPTHPRQRGWCYATCRDEVPQFGAILNDRGIEHL